MDVFLTRQSRPFTEVGIATILNPESQSRRTGTFALLETALTDSTGESGGDFTSRILDGLAMCGGLVEPWKGIGCCRCRRSECWGPLI
jgi:hypothetical protein